MAIPPSSDTPPSGNSRGLSAPLAAALAAALAHAAFLAIWWNRHLGLSLDGYMPWFGHRILTGEVPYRDFFLHLPPLQPLFEALIEAVAGRSILAGRFFGATVGVLTAATLAAWLARFHRPWTAVLASVAAVAVGTADDTEILDLYNHHAAFAAVASGLAAAIALDARGRRRTAAWLVSGVLAAGSIWIKQTIGLGATLVVPIVLAVVAWRPEPGARGRALRDLLHFSAGWAAVSALLLGWLASQGAAGAFFSQVFGDAAGSKGNVATLLVRPFVAPYQLPSTRLPAWIALALTLVAVGLLRLSGSAAIRRAVGVGRALLLGAAAFALTPVVLHANAAVRWLLRRAGKSQLEWIWETGYGALVLASFYFVLVVGVVEALRGVARRESFDAQRLLLAAVGASVAGTLALSYPLAGNMAIVSLAFLIAHLAEAEPRRRPLRVVRPLSVLVAVVALVAAVGVRVDRPFAFAGWTEPPISRSVESSTLPELAGLRLSDTTVRAVDEITRFLRATTDPGEPIFTFSVYPIFHWLADRPTATFASLHWIDVTPDPVTRRDLATIRARPPVAVVRQWIPEDLLALNEVYFREGRRSALREMQEGLNQLLEEGYVLQYAAPKARPRAPAIELWLRSDRARVRRIGPDGLVSERPSGEPGTAP